MASCDLDSFGLSQRPKVRTKISNFIGGMFWRSTSYFHLRYFPARLPSELPSVWTQLWPCWWASFKDFCKYLGGISVVIWSSLTLSSHRGDASGDSQRLGFYLGYSSCFWSRPKKKLSFQNFPFLILMAMSFPCRPARVQRNGNVLPSHPEKVNQKGSDAGSRVYSLEHPGTGRGAASYAEKGIPCENQVPHTLLSSEEHPRLTASGSLSELPFGESGSLQSRCLPHWASNYWRRDEPHLTELQLCYEQSIWVEGNKPFTMGCLALDCYHNLWRRSHFMCFFSFCKSKTCMEEG